MKNKSKLLELARNRLRVLHKSIHTERRYLSWITGYITFCNRHEPNKAKWRHPKDCGRHEVEAFLTYLAVEKHVAASTQNQAFSALVFLYREVLDQPFKQVNKVSKCRYRCPLVLGFPLQKALDRSPLRHQTTAPHASEFFTKSGERCHPESRDKKTCPLPYLPPLLCDPFVRVRHIPSARSPGTSRS